MFAWGQSALAKSSIFGDRLCLCKSLREEPAMELAKETLLVAKDSALGSWRHALRTCIFAGPAPV